MKIQAIDLRNMAGRIPLYEVIPLAAPFSLYIEPTSLCNLRCKFCPTGYKELRQQRPNGVMPLDRFMKIVGDIEEFGVKLKRVNLYKDGEPLVNRDFPDMVDYLKWRDVTEQIWTKTNGVLLNPQINARLIKAGLDFIGISVNQVTARGYEDVCDKRIDYDRFVENIADLYQRRGQCKVYVKIIDTGLTFDEIFKFYADFSDIADYVAVEYLHGWSASDTMDFQLGTRPDTFEGFPLTNKIACPLPFFMLGINWDGTVSLCNEDWAHKTIVGDLKRQTLKEVWNGSELNKMRRRHLEGRRDTNPMCANCHYLKTLPDNIDPWREEILRRLK